MKRRWIAAAAVLALVAFACGGTSIDLGDAPAAEPAVTTSVGPTTTPAVTITPRPQPPSTAAPRPNGAPIRVLDVTGISFELFDEGENCLSVFISRDDITPIAESRCFNEFNVVAETTSCGWLVGSDGSAVCDAGLPVVLFGQIANPDIGHVCMGSLGEADVDAGVVGARFLDIDDDGIVFEAAGPGESARTAHLYGPRGNQYGEPPLDAPSGYIYERCEELAPWGETGDAYFILLNVYFADELRTDAVTAWFDAGLGTTGLSGGAHEGVPADFDVRASATSRGLTVGIDVNDSVALVRTTYPWPDEVAAILEAGSKCSDHISVDVSVAATAAEGDAAAVELAFDSAACS